MIQTYHKLRTTGSKTDVAHNQAKSILAGTKKYALQ